jgi:hypothetical protein
MQREIALPVVAQADALYENVMELDRDLVVPYCGTMSKHDDTLEQIRRLNGGLHWKKVEALLRHLSADVYEGSGSTVTFVLGVRKLTVDRPHPRRECGIGLVKRVRDFLVALGHL